MCFIERAFTQVTFLWPVNGPLMSFTLSKFYFGSQQWDFKSFHFDETKIEHFLAYTDALYKSQSIDATTIQVLPLSLLVFFSLSFHAHTFCQPGIMYLSHLLTHTHTVCKRVSFLTCPLQAIPHTLTHARTPHSNEPSEFRRTTYRGRLFPTLKNISGASRRTKTTCGMQA